MSHDDPYDPYHYSDDPQVTGVPDTSVGTMLGMIILGAVFATVALTKWPPATKAPAETAVTKQVSKPTAKP